MVIYNPRRAGDMAFYIVWLPGSVSLSHSWDEVSEGGPDLVGLVSSSSEASRRTLPSVDEGTLTSC